MNRIMLVGDGKVGGRGAMNDLSKWMKKILYHHNTTHNERNETKRTPSKLHFAFFHTINKIITSFSYIIINSRILNKIQNYKNNKIIWKIMNLIIIFLSFPALLGPPNPIDPATHRPLPDTHYLLFTYLFFIMMMCTYVLKFLFNFFIFFK